MMAPALGARLQQLLGDRADDLDRSRHECVPQSAVRPSMRILGRGEGMPELPSSRMMLMMQPQRREDVGAPRSVIRNIVTQR